MKIADVLELRERIELLPIQRDGIFNEAVDFKLPLVERDHGMNTEVEHGPILNELLARRQTTFRADCGLLFARHFASPPFFPRDKIVVHAANMWPPVCDVARCNFGVDRKSTRLNSSHSQISY